jgi:hypothetical protein
VRTFLSIALSTLIAGVLTLLMLRYSASTYRLAIAPTYDDVVYFIDGFERLMTLREEGLVASVREFFAQPPHAPLQTVMAMAAFALAGPEPAAAYAMQGVLVALLLLAVAWMLRREPWWILLAGLVIAAAPRTCMLGIADCRPEFAMAVFLAIGTMRLCEVPLERAGRESLMLTGACFALALLSKPTMFPMTLWMLGVAGGSAVLSAVWRRRRTREFRTALALILWAGVPIVVIAGPYYFAAFGEISSYIRENLFGANRGFWTHDHGWYWHFEYYFAGDGSNTAFGPNRYVVPVVVAVGAAMACGRRSRLVNASLVQWSLVLLAALAMPTLVGMKVAHFGMPLYLLVVLAAAAALREFGSRWRERMCSPFIRVAPVVAFVLLAIAVARMPRGWLVEPETLREHADVEQEVYACVARQNLANDDPIAVTTAGFLNAQSLHWISLREGKKLSVGTTTFLSDERAVYARLSEATAVVASRDVTWGMNANLPGTQMQNATFDWLASQATLEEVCRIESADGGMYAVFVRRPEP